MEVGGFRYIPYSTLSLIITLACVLTGLPFLMGNGVYLFEAMDGTVNPIICMAVSKATRHFRSFHVIRMFYSQS
jgi:hypothetical protein